MPHLFRRLGLLTAGTLVAGGLTLTGTGSAQAVVAPGGDPAPAADAATWLAGKVPASRILRTSYVYEGTAGDYDDYGLTIDAAAALTGAGGQSALVAQMTDALAASVDTYATSFGTFYAANAAKVAAYLLDQGRTGAAVDSAVDQTAGSVSTTAPTTGAIQNSDGDASTDDGLSNNLGQAFAVHALVKAGRPEAASATTFLLSQQCTAGFFREGFSPASQADQSCNAAEPAASASVDATALVVQQLQPLKADPAVAAALARAVTWLQGAQRTDGSFTTGDQTGPNTNSTGLAATALGVSGAVAPAQRAALWIRGRQLANAGTCAGVSPADDGAVVLDDLALANARASAMNAVATSEAVRATGQALPALAYAPGGAAAGDSTLAVPGFVRAGGVGSATLSGAPGNTVCVSVAGTSTTKVLGADGTLAIPLSLTVPGAVPVSVVDAGGEVDAATATFLGAKKLKLSVKDRTVRKGDRVVLQVKGLAPGEPVTIRLHGRTVTKKAGLGGRKRLRIAVAGKPGRATVVVKGAFGTRKGKTTVRVLR